VEYEDKMYILEKLNFQPENKVGQKNKKSPTLTFIFSGAVRPLAPIPHTKK
jgi:hypothetical protein